MAVGVPHPCSSSPLPHFFRCPVAERHCGMRASCEAGRIVQPRQRCVFLSFFLLLVSVPSSFLQPAAAPPTTHAAAEQGRAEKEKPKKESSYAPKNANRGPQKLYAIERERTRREDAKKQNDDATDTSCPCVWHSEVCRSHLSHTSHTTAALRHPSPPPPSPRRSLLFSKGAQWRERGG